MSCRGQALKIKANVNTIFHKYRNCTLIFEVPYDISKVFIVTIASTCYWQKLYFHSFLIYLVTLLAIC